MNDIWGQFLSVGNGFNARLGFLFFCNFTTVYQFLPALFFERFYTGSILILMLLLMLLCFVSLCVFNFISAEILQQICRDSSVENGWIMNMANKWISTFQRNMKLRNRKQTLSTNSGAWLQRYFTIIYGKQVQKKYTFPTINFQPSKMTTKLYLILEATALAPMQGYCLAPYNESIVTANG